MTNAGTTTQPLPDPELDAVLAEIENIPDFQGKTAGVIRKAIDNVLQGDRTRRYSISQLTPEEKKHIGTQVERGLKSDFFQDRAGKVSDTTIADVEVDIKNTIGRRRHRQSLVFLIGVKQACYSFSPIHLRENLERGQESPF